MALPLRCPTLLDSDPAQCQQIGWVVAFTGAGFVRQALEIVEGEALPSLIRRSAP